MTPTEAEARQEFILMMDAKELAGRFPEGASAAGLERAAEFELGHCLCLKHLARALTLRPEPAVCGFLITSHSQSRAASKGSLASFYARRRGTPARRRT